MTDRQIEKRKIADLKKQIKVRYYLECFGCGNRLETGADSSKDEIAEAARKAGWDRYYHNDKLMCRECLEEAP
jgi:hypothetical protein